MTIPFEHRLVMTCRLASLFLLVRETAAVCMTCNYLFVISLFLQFDRTCIYIYVLHMYKLVEPLCFVFRRTDVCCMRSPCYFKQIYSLIVILVQCILYTCTMYCKCMIFGCSSHFAFF